MAIQEDKVDGTSIVVWGALLVLAVALIVIVLEGFYYGFEADQEAARYEDGSIHASYKVELEQQQRLAGGIKMPSGKTSLSIEEAMRQVVERESK
jgi:hypothetical protein